MQPVFHSPNPSDAAVCPSTVKTGKSADTVGLTVSVTARKDAWRNVGRESPNRQFFQLDSREPSKIYTVTYVQCNNIDNQFAAACLQILQSICSCFFANLV